MRSIIFLPLVAALLSTFVGCAAKPLVSGKVITGSIDFIGVVDKSDERLAKDGVPDVTVRALANPGTSPVRIGSVTSDAKGDFGLSITDQNSLIRNVRFEAEKPGYLPAGGTMNIPPSDKRLLIIMRPSGVPASSGK